MSRLLCGMAIAARSASASRARSSSTSGSHWKRAFMPSSAAGPGGTTGPPTSTSAAPRLLPQRTLSVAACAAAAVRLPSASREECVGLDGALVLRAKLPGPSPGAERKSSCVPALQKRCLVSAATSPSGACAHCAASSSKVFSNDPSCCFKFLGTHIRGARGYASGS